jgi:8-oxo-dGTP diphosphatase
MAKYFYSSNSRSFSNISKMHLLQIWAVISTVLVFVVILYETVHQITCPYKFHGGSPTHQGSCWCGNDSYCLCTPSLAIDAIIEILNPSNKEDIKILLVFRRDPPKEIFAIPGGFVDVGESVENAVIREVKEETNLTVSHLEQFHVYSDPSRDKRRHTVSVVFRCFVENINYLHTGDDAKQVRLISLKSISKLKMAFDHSKVLEDYIKKFHSSIVAV